MRAFVEVDPTVGLMCLEAGLELKREFAGKCEVQLVAFAQDPLFYPDDRGKEEEMERLMSQAAAKGGIDVVGSAPYVESWQSGEILSDTERKKAQKAQQRRNIERIFELAKQSGKHVDFHLDYDSPPR